ncbi:hypothetical protein OG21DRAFT_411088 [Imleria badia]|nr:hypothetical protein OG21DRAFT_411088 [Imleria badia]
MTMDLDTVESTSKPWYHPHKFILSEALSATGLSPPCGPNPGKIGVYEDSRCSALSVQATKPGVLLEGSLKTIALRKMIRDVLRAWARRNPGPCSHHRLLSTWPGGRKHGQKSALEPSGHGARSGR